MTSERTNQPARQSGRPSTKPHEFIFIRGPHPAQLDESALHKQCSIQFGRASGPGGQHRNKTETAAMIVHEPTGVSAAASERRSQTVNRAKALRRLRIKLARTVRRRVPRDLYRPSERWVNRRQGTKLPVNPGHWDYAALLAEALDVIVARGYDVAGAAGVLGVTMSQLTRLVHHDKASFVLLNQGRTARGLPALRK